ncbi:hypothetical protein THF5H11_130041 [Vibrio jasicida]|nr:hypothetical protein THF5H11_130041 [Vibrio jasicida]
MDRWLRSGSSTASWCNLNCASIHIRIACHVCQFIDGHENRTTIIDKIYKYLLDINKLKSQRNAGFFCAIFLTLAKKMANQILYFTTGYRIKFVNNLRDYFVRSV